MSEQALPLLDALLHHSRLDYKSFHVPGHKSGKGLLPSAASFRELMEIDLTEITGMDDLHSPEGIIREAQQLAADCFGAEETFFLVGGSTAGNLASITTLCMPGDILIVQRNVHKSVINGLMLAGAKAVFVSPRYDAESGLPSGLDKAGVEFALQQYPEAKGVLVTNPNYYGMGTDVRGLADLAHAYGKPLIVDEAHGAHYGFHPALPKSALSCGADLVVQSTHKMLTAMTMGAMLHVQGERIDRELLRSRLAMLQSSSPSYPILASLDAARHLLQTEGNQWLARGLQAVQRVESALAEWSWYRMLPDAPAFAYETKDPFKLTISDATGTLSGYELQSELEARGVMTEMADPRHVLLVFSLASDEGDADRLITALARLAGDFRLSERTVPASAVPAESSLFREGVSASVAFGMGRFGDTTEVTLSDAAGRIAGEMVIPYPPGIPVLYPGETITGETITYLQQLADRGARFQGASSPRLQTIRVAHGPDQAGNGNTSIE
ncbi:aminotransferase class I/II-fold pyridoxal phosphate-dependent enzyme [Paenibacillus ginsengarvi]|uniref:Aminotransferase class I/II-fold pyridoxal phosphate-dependent enzyme n=1 Tax=Paenibacillus ginsengarvi TaxID=400777 RepID=A0A3B0AZN7_9BACL|nr:aminotransferase class I/II-fold pyridoxal phosphate-dependent enzyme [Paenibacillus ginsengarvi]RKN65718.1 aminotransferase class I/II-fold pyridoxal phosphate-dependent enzyme [Paenibacillus ginsengarvi]